MDAWPTLLWGIFGGAGAELAVVIGVLQNPGGARPYWFGSKLYWTLSFVMVIAGGGIALAHAESGSQINPLLAIQIGASAPLIFRKLRDTFSAPEAPNPERIN